MNNPTTMEKMAQMRLWGMQRALRGVLEGGISAKYTADELIGHLVDAEWDERHNRRLARLTRNAHFRYQACLEQIDFQRARNLDKNMVLRLSDGSWVQEHRNLIISGPTGCRQELPQLGHRPPGLSTGLQDPLLELHQVLPTVQALGRRRQLPQGAREDRQDRRGDLR